LSVALAVCQQEVVTGRCRQRKVFTVECVNMNWSVRQIHRARCRSHHVFTQAGVPETVPQSTA